MSINFFDFSKHWKDWNGVPLIFDLHFQVFLLKRSINSVILIFETILRYSTYYNFLFVWKQLFLAVFHKLSANSYITSNIYKFLDKFRFSSFEMLNVCTRLRRRTNEVVRITWHHYRKGLERKHKWALYIGGHAQKIVLTLGWEIGL
jgi:hypothetical protein